MKKYFPIKIYGYQHPGKNSRSKEWKRRINSPFAYRTNLEILAESSHREWGINRPYKLFLIFTPKLYLLSDTIHRNSHEIKNLIHELTHN